MVNRVHRVADAVARTIPWARPALRAANQMYLDHVRAPAPGEFVAIGTETRPTGRFADLLFAHEGLQSTKWYHYCEIYDRLFAGFLGGFPQADGSTRPLRFLEIGVRYGGSMQIWRDYFPPDSVIFGADIDPRCKVAEQDGIQVRIGSQADPGFLRSIVEEMGGVDVVLDDGSHVASHQRTTFDTLFPLVSEGGLFVVEDTVTAYWASFGGGFRRPGTMVEVAKGMVDGLSKSWFHAPVGRRARVAHAEIESIQFFESMIAFEKRTRRPPLMKLAGDVTF